MQLTRWISSLRVLDEQCAQATDAQLLHQFLDEHSGSAFAVLLKRHGPMVLSVCWRVLGHPQDAEDVFQATFLVLAQVARSIRKVDSLSAWLHGVAFRLAQKMKKEASRRRRREQGSPALASSDASADLSLRELWAILHEELNQLPRTELQPLLLCYFEGLTQEEAAAQLSWPRGTLKRRLERGRDRLRSRLLRRGVMLGSLGISLLMDAPVIADHALVSVSLGESTVRACVLLRDGCTLPAGLVSTHVLSLVQGALRTMMLSKLRFVLIAVLMFSFSGVGAWYSVSRAGNPSSDPAPEKEKPQPPATTEPRKLTDLDRFQGTWRIVRGESSGRDLPNAALEHQRLTFKKKELAWETVQQGGFSVAFKIDPAKKPGHIDIDGGGRVPPMTGIYKFEEKKLILALAPETRPEGFVTNQQSQFFVYQLERLDAEEKPRAKEKPAEGDATKDQKKDILLPKDPKAVVIYFDLRHGNAVEADRPPVLAIHADGKVVITDPTGAAKNVEGKLTAKELQDLMRFVVVDRKFYASSNNDVQTALMNAVRDAGLAFANGIDLRAPVTHLSIYTRDKDQEVSCPSLEFCAGRYPKCESVVRLFQIQERLDKLMKQMREKGKKDPATSPR
jgi:RNA polymerase sigma factor (sigma-70 family)